MNLLNSTTATSRTQASILKDSLNKNSTHFVPCVMPLFTNPLKIIQMNASTSSYPVLQTITNKVYQGYRTL